MIQILGIKRIVLLAAIVAINALLAALVYGYLQPHNDALATQLQTVSGQLTQKRGDTQTLAGQYQVIEDQKVYFGNLQAAGFFGDQNRTLVRTRIADIQKFTNVLSAKYDVTAAKVEHNQAADDAGYVILDSPVSIGIDALDDTDLYTFIYCLENAFPGHVSVTRIEAKRSADVSEATLKQIGNGTAVPLVHGTVNFNWQTMVPATQVSGSAGAAPKG